MFSCVSVLAWAPSFVQILGMQIRMILPVDEGRGGAYPQWMDRANLMVVERMEGNVSVINCECGTENSVLITGQSVLLILLASLPHTDAVTVLVHWPLMFSLTARYQ